MWLLLKVWKLSLINNRTSPRLEQNLIIALINEFASIDGVNSRWMFLVVAHVNNKMDINFVSFVIKIVENLSKTETKECFSH